MNMNPSHFVFNELTIITVTKWPRSLKVLEFWFLIFFTWEKLRRPLFSLEGKGKEENGSLVPQLAKYRRWLHLWQLALLRSVKFWRQKSKSMRAVPTFSIRLTFHLHKNSQNCCHQTRFVFLAQNIRKMRLLLGICLDPLAGFKRGCFAAGEAGIDWLS